MVMKVVFGIVKVLFRIVKVMTFCMGAVLILGILINIPGYGRFKRYLSYPDMKALINAEKDDIVSTIKYERNGTDYTFVLLKPCRFLASGAAVLVYDPEGRLFDKSRDSGDDGRFQRAWPRPW